MMLAQKNVKPTDWVFADFQAYYGIKPVAAVLFLPTYLSRATIDEKQRINLLIINPEDFIRISNALGGSWRDTGEFINYPLKRSLPFGALGYNLRVWRRVS